MNKITIPDNIIKSRSAYKKSILAINESKNKKQLKENKFRSEVLREVYLGLLFDFIGYDESGRVNQSIYSAIKDRLDKIDSGMVRNDITHLIDTSPPIEIHKRPYFKGWSASFLNGRSGIYEK